MESKPKGKGGRPPGPPKPPKTPRLKSTGGGNPPKSTQITDGDTFSEGWNKLSGWGKVRELFNIHRALRSSGDTPILRQGRVITFNDPVVAARAAKEMMQSVISKEHYNELNKE